MNYEEFMAKVQEEMPRLLPGDVQISYRSFVRNNDTPMDCMIVREPGMNIAPKILDLAIIFTINDDNGDSVITRAIFDHWNITEEELFATAKKNTSADDYYRVEPMVNIVARMYGIPVEVVKQQLELPDSLYVISTESYQYGATALLNNELLGKISDECGSDLCIIPSSIHDLIVFPDIDDEQNEFVQENISSVNSTLQPEDVLSDRMYRFVRSKRTVTL